MGRLSVRGLHRGFRLFGVEGGAGDGGGDSDLDSGDRAGAGLSAAIERAGKRDHHRHRRACRIGGGGRDFHAAGALHFEARSASATDHFHLRGGRMPGSAVPDSAAPLLRKRHARHSALPGGHRDHGGAGDRRKRRRAGEVIVAGHGDFRRLRFSGDHLPRVEGVSGFSIRPGDSRALREGADRGQLRRDQFHSRNRLRDGAAQLADSVRGRSALKPGAGAVDLDDRQPQYHRGLSGHFADRANDGGADFSRLRALHRSGRDCDGGDFRNRKIAAHRGGVFRRGAARVSGRREDIGRAHGPGPADCDDFDRA